MFNVQFHQPVGARPTCNLTKTNFTTFNWGKKGGYQSKTKRINKIKKNKQEKRKQKFLAASFTT